MPIRTHFTHALSILAIATVTAGDDDLPPTPNPPLPPEQASELFRLDDGLTIELVAAEPLISSPVEVAFDERGRLWVVEMLDYPNGPAPGQPPQGRIKILGDRDGDGRYDEARVFADGLLFANGVLPWEDGAIVTMAPAIVHLHDRDGDGRADESTRLFEGFAAENPQLRVSHPTLGLDGWIYVANGLRGGKVRRAGTDDPPIELGARDFRFDPRTGRGEAISGPGQYGLTFDDWGRRFVCDNRHHLRYVAFPDEASRRNPFLAVPETLDDISVLGEGLGFSGGKIYPISRNWTTSSLHAGRFTAACGITVYRGDLLPEPYRGAIFTCDPTGNIVHMEVLTPNGASFRSRPAREGVEFLATPDPWFRPVNLYTGPDGAFYLVDMYRAVIEHPEYMPPELRNRPDLNLGRERGRIWRIVPKGAKVPKMPDRSLASLSTPELVALLGHPNAWWRTTAQRLLLGRSDPEAIELLKSLVLQSDNDRARVHALGLLSSFDAASPEVLAAALGASSARVREQAVRLSSSFGAEGSVRDLLRPLAPDPDPMVRFQVALALGASDDTRNIEPLARIALAGADDRWTRLAVLSSVPTGGAELLGRLLTHELPGAEPTPARRALVREVAAIVGARGDRAEVGATVALLAGLEGADVGSWQLAGLGGLAEGMARSGPGLAGTLRSLRENRSELAPAIDAMLDLAVERSAGGAIEDRLEAIGLQAVVPWDRARKPLEAILTADPEPAARVAAARALGLHEGPGAAAVLLGPWQSYPPAVRREAAEALLRRQDRVATLLDALEAGQVRPGDLDIAQVARLRDHASPPLRERARKLLEAGRPQERREALARYRPAIERPGNVDRGRAVFQKNCATCHRVGDIGVDVGPDIADTRTKTREQLLSDILDPNGAIDGNYVGYLVATRDGNVLDGVLAAETASSVTLRRTEGRVEVLLRRDIEDIRSTGLSLMPEGLEKQISPDEMADLLTFLKDWRYQDGLVPAGISSDPKPAGR